MTPIVEGEERLDRMLPEVRLDGGLPAAMIAATAAWSEAVWQDAARLGPAPLGPDERARAAAIAAAPVFVCGAHRSGTTLVRDLLDGHPALAVLPSEGSFFTNFHRRIENLTPASARERLGRIWLGRLANPINQPPYWLLGRSTAEASPYVAFARVYLAMWGALQPVFGARAASWPTAAVALAYAYVLVGGRLDPRLSRWVEKTPTNEQHLDRLGTEFPSALVIHVVRDPLDVMASRKLLEERATGGFSSFAGALHDLVRSYRIARDRSAAAGHASYLVLRYEDVTLDAGAAADRLAAFLGIERIAGLCCPTVAGEPTPSNTSWAPATVRGQIAAAPHRSAATLTRFQRDMVIAATASLAGRLGYTLQGPVVLRVLRVLRVLKVLKDPWSSGSSRSSGSSGSYWRT